MGEWTCKEQAVCWAGWACDFTPAAGGEPARQILWQYPVRLYAAALAGCDGLAASGTVIYVSLPEPGAQAAAVALATILALARYARRSLP